MDCLVVRLSIDFDLKKALVKHGGKVNQEFYDSKMLRNSCILLRLESEGTSSNYTGTMVPIRRQRR